MFQCRKCEEWFHGKCIKMTSTKWKQQRMHEWNCPVCSINLTDKLINTDSQPAKMTSQPQDSLGLNILIDAEPEEINNQRSTVPVNIVPMNGDVECKECGKFFKGTRGLSTHISKAHPSIQRTKTCNKYADPSCHTSVDTDESPKEANKEIERINDLLETYRIGLNSLAFQEDVHASLDQLVDQLTKTLFNAIDVLPGPKHPARKFYNARKSGKTYKSNDRHYKDSLNPQKMSKRDRNRRKEKFNHEIMQFNYYNRRKKCVQQLMNNDKPQNCTIPSDSLYESFRERWETVNNHTRPDYGNSHTAEEVMDLSTGFHAEITADEILNSIKGIHNDTSPGPDGILIRTLKSLTVSPTLAALASAMIRLNIVPSSFREARTILTYKSGDVKDPSNWRPISICSILRRVIERALDKRLRQYISLSPNQRGFTSVPGCHINSSILNGILHKAKSDKSDVSIIFLDITKAFDCIGHEHLKLTLERAPIPSPLRNLIWSLQEGNFAKIDTNGNKTPNIHFKRGVLQGAPLSPILFNMTIDFILREISEKEVAAQYGFSLAPNLDPISALGFADDTVAIGKSTVAAAEITHMTISLFAQIGLDINFGKSVVINIKKGKLCEECFSFGDTEIRGMSENEKIKYLGVTFKQEIILDKSKLINTLKSDLEKLVGCPMLRPNQKLTIINQYLWPSLIYPLQTAPLNKLSKGFLEDIDKIVRSAVKEALGLPSETPDSMIYSNRNMKGLGVTQARWEAFVQTYNICMRLSAVQDPYVTEVRNLESEMNDCLKKLDVPLDLNVDTAPSQKSKAIRQFLQNREFDKWCAYPYKGKGIILSSQCPPSNKWITEHKGLSSSEWVSCLKMIGNVAPVRSIHGTTLDARRCRHCSETETLAHVLGKCPHGELLRNTRHHRIRSLIAAALAKTGLTVFEEIHCSAELGSNRRIDMIAFDKDSRQGFIIDPTIRTEANPTQPEDVNLEKQEIYYPCVPDLMIKYNLQQIDVIGLFVGSRGTISSFFENFRKRFKLPVSLRGEVVLAALKGSCQILHHHLYTPTPS
jgi:Reverse transcriptase (RNA-dependent DNA polymerase)